MIYIITDPRENRQEIYVGQTGNQKKRFNTHLNDGRKFSKSEYHNKYLGSSKTSLKARWISQILDAGLEPVMTIIDKDEIYSEGDWIKTFAENNFILTNSSIDVQNALDSNTNRANSESVPNYIFNKLIDELEQKKVFTNIHPKIFITSIHYDFREYGESTINVHSYPTKQISYTEQLEIQGKYYQAFLKLEENYYGMPTAIIFDEKMYLMDEEYKRMIVRDYFNNDIMGAVINNFNVCRDYDEFEANIIYDDIKELQKLGFELKDEHKERLAVESQYFPKFKEFLTNKIISEKETKPKTLKI